MISLCLYFQAHQPSRIRELSFFEIGNHPDLFDHALNKKILSRVSKNSYLPCFRMFGELIRSTKGKFRFGLSATGLLLEQMEGTNGEGIDSIRSLLSTGAVEMLGETYYHSFASLYSPSEFEEQVIRHKNLLKTLFNIEPAIFRNTELAFRSDMTKTLEKTGFSSLFIEGCERTLKGKSGNFLYSAPGKKGMKIFTRNQGYSNLFSRRAPDQGGKKKFPDTAELVERIAREEGEIINIWFDIECMGEHQKASSGIFDFFEAFVVEAVRSGKVRFILPSEAESALRAKGTIEIFSPVTWHIKRNDISAWNGNAMQIEAMKYIYSLEDKLKAAGNENALDSWRRLQSSDHFLYMDTDETNGTRPAQQFSPFNSPHEAYIYLMNALASLELEAEPGKES